MDSPSFRGTRGLKRDSRGDKKEKKKKKGGNHQGVQFHEAALGWFWPGHSNSDTSNRLPNQS